MSGNRTSCVPGLHFSDYRGGLNGSTQHSSRTRLALKTKAKSLARVRSAGTLRWLGFDRGQPNRPLLPEEALSNQRIGWCCIDRLSRQLAVDSMGRRNTRPTRPKSTYRGLNCQQPFASVDSSGTPSWQGSDWGYSRTRRFSMGKCCRIN